VQIEKRLERLGKGRAKSAADKEAGTNAYCTDAMLATSAAEGFTLVPRVK
jgi:hypothetical protein